MIVMKQHAQKQIVTTSKIKGHIILKKEKKATFPASDEKAHLHMTGFWMHVAPWSPGEQITA